MRRAHEEDVLIGKGMFKKETDISSFFNLKVTCLVITPTYYFYNLCEGDSHVGRSPTFQDISCHAYPD